MPVKHLVNTGILTINRVQHATGRLNEPRHHSAKTWSQRDSACNKQSDITEVNRPTGLAAESEWPASDNDWTLKS
jgi:hypothetical protein